MPYGDYYSGPDVAVPLTGHYETALDYGGYASARELELGKSGIQPYSPQGSDYNVNYRGAISNSLPLIGGMIGFVTAFENAQLFRKQEKMLKKAAAQAFEEGAELARDIELEGGEVLGSMTAAYGKSGTLLEGSPLLALADTQTQIERNVRRAIEQGRLNQQALLWQARQAKRAGYMEKVGGFAKLAENWGTSIARFGGSGG